MERISRKRLCASDFNGSDHFLRLYYANRIVVAVSQGYVYVADDLYICDIQNIVTYDVDPSSIGKDRVDTYGT